MQCAYKDIRTARLQKCTEITFIIHKLFRCNLGDLVIDNAFNKIIQNKTLVMQLGYFIS